MALRVYYSTVKGRLFYPYDQRVIIQRGRVDYSTDVGLRVYYPTVKGILLYGCRTKGLLSNGEGYITLRMYD